MTAQGLRRLVRAPLFAIGTILTLALGLGAAAAVLAIADTFYLRALPLDEPDRLVRLFVTPPGRSDHLSPNPDTFLALERETKSLFEGVAGQRLTTRTLLGADGAEQVETIGVTAGWARLLGVRPQLGRVFTAEEEAEGEPSEAVLLADGTWRDRFGADPAIVGRRVVLDGATKTIVGVLPRGFVYPYEADFWHPTRADRPSSSPWAFNAPARLRDGITLAEANAALAALGDRLDAVQDERHRGLRPIAVPLREVLLDGEDRTLSTAGLVVVLLLALVVANLAAFFHARWLAMRREIALRSALGGGRARIVAALAAESGWIAGAGLGLGLLLAALARPIVARQVPARLADVGATLAAGPRVALLVAGVALVAVALAALLPAWRLARVDSFRWLRADAGAGGGRDVRRTTRTLVSLQVGLALALAAATFGLIADLRARARLDLGYDPDGRAFFTASLSAQSYDDPATRQRFVDAVVERLDALPGVERAAAVHLPPSGRGSWLAQVERADRESTLEGRISAQNRFVTPDYLTALGLRLEAGRWLTSADRAGAPPVVVLSASLARRLFPDGDAVGRRVRNAREAGAEGTEVVGVVADVHEFTDGDEAWYRPFAQHADSTGSALPTFVLRSAAGAPPPTLRQLRDLVATVDPQVAIFDLVSPRELLAETVVAQRDAASASGFLAGFGVALAALGLFVRLAEAVLRRRRELAVRLALGASHRRIVGQLVGEGLGLALVGFVPGTLAALALLRVVARQLDAPALAADPLPILFATAVTAAAVGAACWFGARRALRLAPAEALRHE